MKTQFRISVGFFLLLLICYCTRVDSKVEDSANNGLDSKTVNKGNDASKDTGSNKDLNSVSAGKEKKSENQVSVSKEGAKNREDKIKKDPESETVSKEGADKVKKDDGIGEEGRNKGEKEKGKPVDNSVSKEGSKSSGKGESTVSSTSKRNDGSSGEDCDSSNKCTDEAKRLVACLRVPGNDSPQLSLLIQNKGKGPLTVKISAPDFVHLEKSEVQLQEEEDKKVKVSIGDGGDGSTIILTAGSGHCSLDFRDLIAHNNAKDSDNVPKSSWFSYLTKPHVIAILAFGVILTIAAVSLFITIRRKNFVSSNSKYQRLDMELPVSLGGKAVADNNDGWENSWDDNWDDETPHTPSLPVTPNLSSKGLASRRLNKDGWKD
ncbi:uncharacterized protein E5676_scaffold21G003830 [Cucumis melo var. makuwa]|uniref:DUF7356 domain-containing protein n=2 Tax=Cucumis melo TaxID=3656 RepID=A0A5D3CXF4_CUCMM|nr:uncharacterized protein E6C27_scaffold74G002010 [Cucumis melo var. makuwa]TYK16563.1 uncharacterized protein E5676_scaffold21G003830 [Cucumis melo var. makuwa]